MSTAASAMTFGMKASVCSWIWVTAWKIDTTRPTIRPAASIGVATLKASVSALVARLTTTSWFMSVEALNERSGDEVPAVDQDEQQDLERERDEDGWQHHHAHRHQGRADDEVDDEERKEDQEADLEGRLELGDHEGRDQRVGRHVGAGLRALEVREVDEEREVLLPRLAEHEVAQRLLAALDRRRLGDLVVRQRIDRVLLDLRQRRRHDEDRQEERDADQDLVGRRGRRAQAGPDEAQDDEDAREARDREQQRRDERQPGDDQQELNGVGALHGSELAANGARSHTVEELAHASLQRDERGGRGVGPARPGRAGGRLGLGETELDRLLL